MRKIITLMAIVSYFLSALSQDFAVKILEESPRHHEWVEVKYNDRTVHCFMVYPEVAKKATAVIVIHENRGLTNWVRSFADKLAANGYIAIAPDFLSGFSEENKKTSDFPSTDEARNAIYRLNPEQITADLDAVFNYVSNIPAANGKVAVAGFCWGGSQTFRYATNNPNIIAACVFYGGAPDDEKEIERIKTPVYGFYGENDERINAGIPKTEELMKKAGKTYNYEIYKGVGHAFMGRGDDPEGSDEYKKATNEAFNRLLKILGKH